MSLIGYLDYNEDDEELFSDLESEIEEEEEEATTSKKSKIGKGNQFLILLGLVLG